MQRDVKMGRISQDVYTQQSIEILAALRKLGEKVNNIAEDKSCLFEPFQSLISSHAL